MADCLLSLITNPSLEESMIDWLLFQKDITGFSTSEIYGHGSRKDKYNAHELVTGRQKKLQFMIHTDSIIASKLINQLKQKFPNTGMHYVIAPAFETGSL